MSAHDTKVKIGEYVEAADGTRGIVLEIREIHGNRIYSVVDSDGTVGYHQEWSLQTMQSRL